MLPADGLTMNGTWRPRKFMNGVRQCCPKTGMTQAMHVRSRLPGDVRSRAHERFRREEVCRGRAASMTPLQKKVLPRRQGARQVKSPRVSRQSVQLSGTPRRCRTCESNRRRQKPDRGDAACPQHATLNPHVGCRANATAVGHVRAARQALNPSLTPPTCRLPRRIAWSQPRSLGKALRA